MGGKEELVQLPTQEGWEELRVRAEALRVQEWGAQQEMEGLVGKARRFQELLRVAVGAALLLWAVPQR